MSAAIVFALLHWRPVFEPITRLIQETFLHRRRHGHVHLYDPDLYWIYPVAVAVVGLILLILDAWALRDGPASEQEIDAYLRRRHDSRGSDQSAHQDY